MAEPARRVSPEDFFRIARNTLGRMACETMNPADGEHNHRECVRDDASWIADLQLRLLAAVASGDEDLVLARTTEALEALTPAA